MLLGSRGIGKTTLLRHVLYNAIDNTDFLPIYIDGRSWQLSDTSLLVNNLQGKGSTAATLLAASRKDVLERICNVFSTDKESELIRDREMANMATFLNWESQHLTDALSVFDELFALYKAGRSPAANWPVICIDSADVWIGKEQDTGSPEKEEALRAVLAYFVKVSMQVSPCGQQRALKV